MPHPQIQVLSREAPRVGLGACSADEIIAHCKSGMRSAKAVEFLKQAGFKKVRNMKGGILAWSDKVDPSLPKY
jgi:adenylyltransferase/sulfurtransferase